MAAFGVLRVLKWITLLFLALIAGILPQAWTDFGARPTGARAERMRASPAWSDGIFVNAQPMWNDWVGMFDAARRHRGHALL